MAKQPKVAIYARVSTDEQNTDAQLRDLHEYVDNRRWRNVKVPVDEHGHTLGHVFAIFEVEDVPKL